METMKAVRIHEFGIPEVMRYEDAPRPEPGPGEALVRVHAAGVNPIDWKIREGYIPEISLPLILGFDLSGTIEALCPGIAELRTGDEVYSAPDRSYIGSYAEYIAVPESQLAFKPKSLDHINAAAVPLAALTAWQALFEAASLSAGQTVLIQGAAGGVGHYAVQFAKWKGAKVIGTATGDGIDLVRELGADDVVDYKQKPFEEQVRDVDVVLDLIGGETQQRSWRVLKKGGVLVSTLGVSSPETAAKHGAQGKAVFRRFDKGQLTQIGKLIDAGQVKVVVQTVLPLAEARHAHEISQAGQARGKIVLRVD
jgi:NADPH:quinone reductase-like Zn-dependent oxidoreductase